MSCRMLSCRVDSHMCELSFMENSAWVGGQNPTRTKPIGVSREESWPPFSWTPLFICDNPSNPTYSHRQMQCKLFLNCLICSLGQHFTDIKGSMYMLVHSLASKYARFVVLVRLMYWTPLPPSDHWTPPFKIWWPFFREPRDIGPPLSKILDTPLKPP